MAKAEDGMQRPDSVLSPCRMTASFVDGRVYYYYACKTGRYIPSSLGILLLRECGVIMMQEGNIMAF